MGDHIVHDGEHGRIIAQERMAVGAGRTGLDRRHLLGGVVAGAAGLLLPRPAAASDLDVRLTVANRDWPAVSLTFWIPTGPGETRTTFRKIYDDTLARGGSLAHWPPQHREPSEAVFQIDGTYNVWAKNPQTGAPSITFLLGADPSTASIAKTAELQAGEAIAWRINSSKGILVRRRKDSAAFQEFTVDLLDVSRQGSSGDNNDKDDKKDNKDNTKRRRKQRGGLGRLSDTDRREHPVHRLLD